jgi:hypothetical protein
MRRLTILALAALATLATSVASAQPRRVTIEERERRYVDPRDQDLVCYDRSGRRVDLGPGFGRWRPLATEVSATSTRQFINIEARAGRFDRIVLESTRGAPLIERVAVEFEDRRTQVWDVNRRLRRDAEEVIDLGGRKDVNRIIVYTNPRYGGAYSVFGT